MNITKKCPCCGKSFIVHSGMQKYCSIDCATEAKRIRVKQKNDLFKVAQPMMEIQSQEYLTFSKAAVLMGCTRQYIYKLVATGKLNASRLSSRMAIVRKADIEKMLEGNPYKRVLPTSKPQNKTTKRKSVNSHSLKSCPYNNDERANESDEVLDFYSGEEVMSLFKVKQSWLYVSAKRNRIPICRIAGKNYYSKKHIDEHFGVSVDISKITEWLVLEEVGKLYGMKNSAIRNYAYRHKIPTKREYGRTYYSKSHFDELRRNDLMQDEKYYTVEQVSEKYGLSSANICHIVKVKHINKVKVGVKNLLLKVDVDRIMAERASQP